MVVSPKLRWLVPYLEIGLRYTPEGKTVTVLKHWCLYGRYGKKESAAIITNDSVSYRIYMKTQFHPRGQNAQNFSKIDLLKFLAHELAHMQDFDHTPAHATLEAKITRVFMQQLKAEGYISEEHELR